MTTPQPQQLQEDGNPTPEQVATVASFIAVGAGAEMTAAAIAGYLGLEVTFVYAALTAQGYVPEFLRNMVNRKPETPPGGPAERTAHRQNQARRAAYTIKSAYRVRDRVRKQGMNEEQAQIAEKHLYEAHMKAMERRVEMAKKVDVMSDQHGNMLGWYATLDRRTDPECRAADGKNFLADRVPVIGYPGTVHPNCRCVPGPPHNTRRMVL